MSLPSPHPTSSVRRPGGGDGRTFMIGFDHGCDTEKLLHDVCHWLVAPKERRGRMNFGLPTTVTDHESDNEEVTVMLLEQLLAPLFKLRPDMIAKPDYNVADRRNLDGAPYTLDDVCARTAEIICEIRRPCCAAYDAGSCIAFQKADCARDVAAVRAGEELGNYCDLDSGKCTVGRPGGAACDDRDLECASLDCVHDAGGPEGGQCAPVAPLASPPSAPASERPQL